MISMLMIARYVMSMWNQWLTPAPTITIDLPCVLCAFSANCRATEIASSRFTPVTASCHAGVYGTSSS